MKNIIFILMVMVLSITLSADVLIKGDSGKAPININQLENVKYCVIVASQKFLSKSSYAEIDIGLRAKIKFSSTDALRPIVDTTGRKIKFNGIVHILNYLDQNGWEFLDSFFLGGKDKAIHFLMKKKSS